LMCDSKSPTSFTLTVIFGSRLDTVDRKSGGEKKYVIRLFSSRKRKQSLVSRTFWQTW
jgi:hypothetical protein